MTYRKGYDRPMTTAERREARRDDRDVRRISEAHDTDWANRYAPVLSDEKAAEKKLRQSMTIAQWNAYKAERAG